MRCKRTLQGTHTVALTLLVATSVCFAGRMAYDDCGRAATATVHHPDLRHGGVYVCACEIFSNDRGSDSLTRWTDILHWDGSAEVAEARVDMLNEGPRKDGETAACLLTSSPCRVRTPDEVAARRVVVWEAAFESDESGDDLPGGYLGICTSTSVGDLATTMLDDLPGRCNAPDCSGIPPAGPRPDVPRCDPDVGEGGPEAATMSLLGLGGLAMLRRRRRKV